MGEKMRPSKLQVAMMVAEDWAKLSHDKDTQVGAVLLKNATGAQIAAGFNGYIRGAPDAVLPNTRPDKYEYMMHAEENIMTNCARHGISMDDCTLVCTMSPCKHCMRLLWQTGITRVIAKKLYKDFDDIMKMKDLGVSQRITPEGFWELTYKEKDCAPRDTSNKADICDCSNK